MAIDWDQLGTRVDEPALEATDWDAFGTRVEDTPEPEPSLPPMAADMPQMLSSAEVIRGGKRYPEQPKQERKFSVLQDEPAMAPVDNVSRAPVTPATRAAINAAFDADGSGGRAGLTKDAGYIGQIARQREAEFARLDESAAGQTDAATALDPRAEKRRQQLIKKGEDPRFAERAASEAARAGGAPGMEVQDLIRGSGTAQEVAALPSTTTEVATNAVMRGVHQFRSMGYGLAAAATQAVGAEDVSLDLLKKYMASEDAARKYPAAVQDFTHIKSLSDVPTYVLEAVLENAPQLVTSIGSGGVGAIVGKKVGEKAVAGMLEEQAKKLLARRITQGMAMGAGAFSIGMETGSIYGQVAEQTGERRPGVALAFGTVAGALDAIPAMRAAGKIMGKEAVSLVLRDIAKRYPVEALKQLAEEGPTEFLQQWAENAATSYVDGRDLFTKDNLIAAIDAALKGAAAGAATGVAAQGIHDARNAGTIARENSPARALSALLDGTEIGAVDAPATAAVEGGTTRQAAEQRMAGIAQAQARLDAMRSGQQADATLAQTAQIRDAAQAQARQAKSESVAAIGQASTADEAIVATQRAVDMDEQGLADWAMRQAGIDPAALAAVESQAQAQRQAAQDVLTQESVTDGTQTQETEQAGAGQQAAQADAVATKTAPVVLQNRDRSTSASITQMNAIAANPDYLRTGPSRTMDQGAPVVFGDLPEGAVLGRTETVADGTGRRVQVRYAVVEAPSVLTSNSADGLANAGYADGRQGMVRAVAGNARGAGLIESWNRGTAQTYRQELLDDAQSLGIDAQAIAVLQRPMLVRLMDAADVTPDMGDRTNIQAGAAMSAVEQAANDVRRVDVRELQFDDAGNPTRETLAAFVNQMPVSERGAMLNSDGTPTKQAIDRLVAAAFKQAYGNDALVELAAQATDPEARTVINALASVAGDMAQLADTGEFDIRQAVSEAAQKAVNARRRGLPLQKALQERDLQDTPEMLVVAQFMADNIRSGKRIADGLRAWARLAREQVEIVQGNAQSAGLFGEAPTLSRAQIFERLGRDGQTESAQRGGPELAAQDTGRQDAPEREREAGSAQDGRAGSQERATQAATEVGEWRSFGRESLGIARADMPQVKAGDRSAFLQFLQARGIDYAMGEADPDSLKPTQAEFSTEKVARFVRGGGVQGERSVLVSSDGYVLDGHHQWLGHRVMGQAIPVIRLDAPIREVLQAANEFPSVRRSEGATNDDTQRDAALRDFKDAMADLADLATKWQRAAIVPEQHPELMQTLVRLFDAAIRIVGTDLKAATKWVRDQLKSDPKTKSLLLKIKQSTYQQAAQQALREMQGAPQGGLFGGLKQASEAVQSDELPQAKPYSQMSADEKAAFDRRQGIRASDRGRVSAASYDMARDNFKPPKISAFIPDSLMAQVRNKIAQLHTAATPGAISAADKARAHAMLTPLLERAREAKLDYDQRVIDIARETGALGQMLATIKSMDSVTRKLVTDPGVNWDLGKMYDTLRSTIVVSSYADAQKVLDAIRSRFDVIPGRVKNVTDAEIDGERGQFLPSGYGQVLVNVRLPGGVIAEIQINTPEMLAVKLNEGHALYEIERAEPDGSQAQRDAVALQNEIYPMAATAARERAFMASERSRSSLDLAEPGDIGKSRAAVSRSEPVSSSNANTRPSGNLTHSVMSPFTANSQPAGNLSGTFIDTSDKSIVSDEGESGKDGVLESYTPAELKARQDARDAAERERANEDARAERKDDADAQRDSFTLTGSDRAADDVNQSDLFGNSAGPKEEVGGGRQRFTVSIPVFGNVAYRASAPVQADGRVLSSRVITSKTPISRSNARLLGLPEDKGAVYAWRVSVAQGQDGPYSVVEAMAQDHGRSTDGEVLAHFKPVDQEVVERVAPAIARAAREDWQAAQDRHNGGLFDGALTVRENGAVYETDLFGDPVPAPARRAVRAQSARAGLRGDVQPAAEIRDTQTPQGQYFVRTIVGHETQRRLGADLIRTPQDAAQATAYLYKSAVERFDAIVTDKGGKPLAVVGGFKGAVSQTSVYPGTVVGEAVRIPGAAHVWFSHNHPSGNSVLSRADENLMRVLSDAFRGSGIEPKGLMAVSNGKFSFLNAEGVAIDAAVIPSAESAASTTVPVIERELAENGATMLIGDPGAALRVAKDFHKQGGDGILLLNAQYAVAAWVPITDQMRGALRHTGALNAIYRAISESNASAAILVHDGALDASHPDSRAVTVGNNIAAALAKVDVRPFDIVNVKTGKSLAQTGLPVAAGPMFSRRASTKAAYEARIDALFSGEKAGTGTRVLDRSDVMGMLGHPDMPLILDESHLVSEGLDAHPEMTAAQWKKVPEWIENPALAYKSRGRIVLVAPERVAGHPVLMVINPEGHATGGRGQANVQLLVTAYAKTRGGVPFGEIEREKSLIYWNTQNAPAMRGSGGVQFSTRAYTELGRGRILTEKHLAGWRRANDTQQFVAASAKSGATVATIATAISQAYGKSTLNKLQAKGLVTLAQSEDEAVEVAAQARAKKTGGDVAQIKRSLTAAMQGGTDLDVKRSASGSIQGFYDPQSGQSFLIADGLTAEAAPGVLVHEVGIHMAADTTSVRGKQAMDALVRRAETLRRMGRGNPFFDRVTQRMRDAGETSREETAAYMAEAYEQDRTNAPVSVKRWVQDFMAAVRAWLFSKGVLIKASQLTPADIAAVARANVRRAADAMKTADQRTLERADDLRFSRQSATAAQGDMFPLRPFTLPDEKLGGVRRKLQDGFIRALHVQNAVAEQGGVVNEATDFYLAEELSSGKRKALADDFKDKEIKPLVERMAELGVGMDELALYAYAMHAHERNARIASINPNFADGGSGMTNAEADAVLAQVKAEGREQAFADLHTDLMRIVDGTRRLMRDSGLITAQQYQAMQAQYQNYIPLRGFEAVEDDGRKTGMPAGRGFNIRGSETVRALGRASRAGNLIETAIVDRLRTIDRSERNQVGKVFLNFVRHNPDPALWEIDATRTRQALDRQTGQVNRTTTIDKGEDTISVKVGGREVYIRINDPLLLRALRNTAKEERGELEMAMMRSVGLYSTLLRNTLTRYNPEFALTNSARDFGFGAAAIVDELGEAAGAKFIGYYAGAIGAAHRYEKGTGGQAGKRKKSEWDRYFNEFRMAGGMTAGFYVKGIDEVQKDVRAMLLDAGAKGTRKELLTRNPAANLVRRTGRVLEWSGSVSENAARVAAYRVAREAGKTPSQAASIAKNLTTNFDRKGEYGQVLNANYVFYNAAVQGSHRMLKMLANPRMLGWMAGMGAAGVATAMLSASMGGDDPDDGMAYWDKIPDYVKERNFIIMLPPGVQMEGAEKVGTQGRYIKIPLQYGLNLPIAYGYVIGDVIRNQRDPNRGMNFKKAAVTLTSYFFGAFNPFDGSVDLSNKDSVILATLPSTFDFLYQQAAGVNGFGRPVAPYKSDFDHKPDSENYNLRQADSVALKVARWLNSSTGGNEAKPGAIDVSAGTIENLIRNLTGGTGTFIYDSVNLAWSAVDSATGGDPDVFVRDVPLARRVYGTLGGDVDQGLFYENRKQADEAFAAAKGQLKIGIQPEPEERAKAMMHKAGTNVTKTLAKIRREMIRVTEDENPSKEQRATRLRELRAKRDQLTSMYNQRFREAMGKFFAEQSSKKESE